MQQPLPQARTLSHGEGYMELNQSADMYFGGTEPSFSSIKHMLTSPQHYFKMLESKSYNHYRMDMGTAIHHHLQNRPHLVKVSDKKGYDLEKEKEQWRIETNKEGIVISPAVNYLAETLEHCSRRLPKVMGIRRNSLVETGIYFCHKGVTFRTRTDFLCRESAVIADIKSTVEAKNYDSFKNWIVSKDYTLQFAIHKTAYEYATGQKLKTYNIIACYTGRNSEEFSAHDKDHVTLYELSDKLMDIGLSQLDRVTERYKEFVINKTPVEQFVERL